MAAAGRLIVVAHEIAHLLAQHLQPQGVVRLMSCCKTLHTIGGVELGDLGKIKATKALEWQARFGHRFSLVGLDVFRCDQLLFCRLLRELPALRSLTVRQPSSHISSLTPVAQANALKCLSLYYSVEQNADGSTQLDVAPLGACSSLQALNLSCGARGGGVRLSHLSALGGCSRLRSLELRNCLVDSEGVRGIASAGSAAAWSIETLRLQGCGVTSPLLLPIRALSKLRVLDLSLNSDLTSTQGLAECPRLQVLILTGCSNLSDVAPLAGCARLHTLYLTACSLALTDVSPLQACAELHTLHLNQCKRVSDASALANCPKLKLLNLRCSGVDFDSAPYSVDGQLQVVFDTTADPHRRQSVGVL